MDHWLVHYEFDPVMSKIENDAKQTLSVRAYYKAKSFVIKKSSLY